MHILPSASLSKANQAMKSGHIIEYCKRKIFFKNHTKNEAGRLVTYLFLFFEEVLLEFKVSGLQLNFNIFW